MTTHRGWVASYCSQSFDIFGHTASSGMRCSKPSQIALALLALSWGCWNPRVVRGRLRGL
jgi:hypothetical protein